MAEPPMPSTATVFAARCVSGMTSARERAHASRTWPGSAADAASIPEASSRPQSRQVIEDAAHEAIALAHPPVTKRPPSASSASRSAGVVASA